MRNVTGYMSLAAGLVLASPAFAAGDAPFFSLLNTDFVVLLGLIVFIGVLIYFNVPSLLGGMLDKRADGIQTELDEARALRDEAQSLLASYERKQREVKDQAERIVAAAKEEATIAAKEARADLAKSLERRMAAAEEQIANAQSAAITEVRDQSVTIAMSVARDVISKQMTAAQANGLIDDAITVVDAKLH
ncbi:MAG: F0F1 ATP synthase subunit B [Marinomonas sp.]